MKFLVVATLLFSINAWSSQKAYNFESFDQAKESAEFFRFDLESTAAGMLTARFPGFAKEIKLSWNKRGNKVKDLKVVLPVESFDTDRDGRNEEMKEDCLEYDKYPEIIVTLDELPLKESRVDVTGKGLIRGKEIEFPLTLELKKVEDQWVISGESAATLSMLNINDPTKWGGFLSFNENVKMSFNFVVEE